MFKKVLTAVVLVLIIAGLIFAGRMFMDNFSASKKSVASINQDTIFELPQFKEAQKKLEEVNIKLQEVYGKEAEKLSEEKRKILTMQLQQRLAQEQAVLLRPLFENVEIAIANIAKKKKIRVVIDNKIAVFGAKDITEEVVNLIKSGKPLVRPKELPQKSPIGYFDEQTIRALKVFQEADEEFFKIYQELQKELEIKLRGRSTMEQNKITEDYNIKLAGRKNDIYSALYKLVTEMVEKTAKDKGLSLVVDKQSIMYGGINLTDEVVEVFLKEVKKLKKS